MAYHGVHTDDVTGDEIASGTVVTLTINNENNGESKTVHVSSDTWDNILEESGSLSEAIFSD